MPGLPKRISALSKLHKTGHSASSCCEDLTQFIICRCRDWNANSGDTGGLVDDSWLTIQWPKVDFLTGVPNDVTSTDDAGPGGWGLTPWYLL